ncbi:MAG TPA: 16S rRNA (guanine(966)-N(2))-methyltransferase RsmD [Blastocatellia bacterium]|nr:16S rRNA (guanine(966)-N(2))-methyltransferase RsmD [Blastocatellia bacterium]
MRVIGGTYGGRRLRSVDGLRVRPTSDRLRETLFNILAPRIADSRFLDICAGSGAVGIEALSRGASAATFIEKSRHACSAIEANLAALGIDHMIILNRDALSALNRLHENQQQFDIIFFDPPYASEIYPQVMETLGKSGLVADGGIVVVEHRAKDPPREEYGEVKMYRDVRQGESALAFYARG